jgi:hypothetical protein
MMTHETPFLVPQVYGAAQLERSYESQTQEGAAQG